MKIPVFTITFDISTFYKHIHYQSKLLQHHPIPKIAYTCIGSIEDERDAKFLILFHTNETAGRSI